MFDRLITTVHDAVCGHDHEGAGPCQAISSRLVGALDQHRLSIVDETSRSAIQETLRQWGYPELADTLHAVKATA